MDGHRRKRTSRAQHPTVRHDNSHPKPIGQVTSQVDITASSRHQDANPYNVLDRFEQLNCEMDKLAKDHWNATVPQAHLNREIYGCPGSLRVQGQAVHSQLKQVLQNHINGSAILDYWDGRERFGAPNEGGGQEQLIGRWWSEY